MNSGGSGPYNITGMPGIEPYNDQLTIGGQLTVSNTITASGGLDMAGNDISNFFGSNCGVNESISQINPDGSYQCTNVTAVTSDQYVDEAGDTMDGDLTLSSGATVTGLPTPSASSDAISRGYAANTYLNRDGSDKMTGALDMDGNSILNAGSLTMSGAIDMGGNAITSANRISGTGRNLRFMRDGTSDDTNYEWAGWYSGSSRAGIFLWDGSWNGCTANQFCIVGDTHQLMLKSDQGHVRIDDTLNINSGGTSGGLHIDGSDAVTGTPANGWLRLNQGGAFGNGIYTPGSMRVDGGMQLRGNLDMRNNQIQNAVLSGSVRLPTGTDQY